MRQRYQRTQEKSKRKFEVVASRAQDSEGHPGGRGDAERVLGPQGSEAFAMNGKLRSFAILLPLLLALIPGARAEGSPVGQSSVRKVPCYAFLKASVFTDSDLYLTCKGKTERITKEGGIGDFAVSNDGTALALSRHTGTEKGLDVDGNPIDIPREEIEVVSLGRGFQTHWCPRDAGNAGLVSSCGTVLAVRDAVWSAFKETHTTHDAVSGKRLNFEPYITFRCSSDRKAVVGHINIDRHVLKAGLPPQRVIVEAPNGSIVAPYDISPNGQYVSYVTNVLCVDKNGKNLGCVNGWGIYPQNISVSDSGAVLFDGGTEETCYLDARGHWSLKHLPGYDDAEECIGVFNWRPGDKGPRVVQRLGWRPQWIRPQAAAALRAWRDYRRKKADVK